MQVQEIMFVFRIQHGARSEKKIKCLDRALNRFLNTNIIFEFRNQPRARC